MVVCCGHDVCMDVLFDFGLIVDYFLVVQCLLCVVCVIEIWLLEVNNLVVVTHERFVFTRFIRSCVIVV